MVPVIRIVIPLADLTEPLDTLQGIVTRGLNADYIIEDRNGNRAIPLSALYAARMNERGQVTVARVKNALLEPDHTFLGWPIPA